ncbi:MAG: ABC transporter C-terminal domain-containing protein [Spirochaetota bacterium]
MTRRHSAAARSGSPAAGRDAGSGERDHGGAARLEEEIMRLERERDTLEERMAEAFARGDYRAGRKAGNDLAELRKRIDELYERWGA